MYYIYNSKQTLRPLATSVIVARLLGLPSVYSNIEYTDATGFCCLYGQGTLQLYYPI